ncbi:hypothetical protein Hdeb2414_s0028g00699631 [Helianthus debilis subsp. tardiflorus]
MVPIEILMTFLNLNSMVLDRMNSPDLNPFGLHKQHYILFAMLCFKQVSSIFHFFVLDKHQWIFPANRGE